MADIDELWRYDGRRAVVTGCASGIGEHVGRQLTDLGAEVIGLDKRRPPFEVNEFHHVDLADPESIEGAVASIGGRVDALFNVAGVSSGIGDPTLVATINFLGLRRVTEALVPKMGAGSSIVSVSSLAAAGYREHADAVVPLLDTATMQQGIDWCHAHPDELGNGYQLSKEAIIFYTMRSATPLGANGIRINCSGPGVTETPILDQLRTAYGQGFLDGIPKPLGRVSGPAEQAAVLLFLNSRAASYITGQVLWVDGGNVGAAIARELEEGRADGRLD
ncbi:coniferyl-alcohol dehydrogenase [Mycobacterium montefiorense]|uniref:3-alpha-hydroxysteroid dehydrogenase n=1 Tax=Mycobacterium montefiorense TaxID=154654 RepID=A0AA37PKD4_9MYCO|nr:coniferyl-alcohol dehydrogenase [Mycobacterium montefiorense]GBG40187.1 3-alpha-hydroxysteroid dehydrogenase [Mycobacterium montefiorense]GKU35288.1 3-alpha-hydroxysteroid dehydrogenase [Mycobacterium montefiorense]GKU40242.1 3-alpha-hydroxysteroid dehydrogenase [Mycobacterium montefiorense]GKU46181.1 3-alpha-hydroxysteroid dehydrogenase [Mycobacterium montefiorense]GKU53053.1 3-alpha-hydroxysteroid dehydrogenase [Mycobacterium montefiorense]